MSKIESTTRITCPNPLCDGYVSLDDTICPTCRHALANCPSCTKLMSRTVGRCAWCGHRLSTERENTDKAVVVSSSVVHESPVIVRFDTRGVTIKERIAQVYSQVALANADMFIATRAIEQVRRTFLTEPDAFKIWDLLDEKIAETDSETVRPAFIELRIWFREQLFDQQRRRLSNIFKRDPKRGWHEWLRTYGEGLAQWRLLLCQNLVEMSNSFPEHFYKPHDFSKATRLLLHERWTELYSFFAYLAEHKFLHPHTRALMLISIGQIQLYYFGRPERALVLFQQAEQLSPGLARALAALGEYYREQNDLAKSRTYLEQAMKAAPDEVDSYALLGDLAEKQGNLQQARAWYEEAINRAIGDSTGYIRLLRLYGNPALITTYESQIAELAERAIAIDETGEYRTYLDVGDAYSSSQRYDVAHQWYDKAINLEPNQLNGYISKGFACLNEGKTRYDTALDAFNVAIRVAPEAYDGYWAMGQWAERESLWAEAAEWYAQAMERQPEFYSTLMVKIGEMQWKIGYLEKAERTLLDALQNDLTNDALVLDLAEDYFKNQNEYEKALQLLKQIRDIKGEAWEAEYQNEVGNLCYYKKEYEQAARHYLNAVHSNEKEAIYYSNLLGAYEKSLFNSVRSPEQLSTIISELRVKIEKLEEKQPLLDQLARLEEFHMFVERYGVKALTFVPVDKPVRVYVSSDVLPFILDADRNLSEDFIRQINVLRDRLQKRFGVRVPGFTFSEFTELDLPLQSYQIQILGNKTAKGQIIDYEGNSLQERLLQCIESTVTNHLHELCGHQETANLLDQYDAVECTQVKNNPLQLRALTRQLRSILKRGESITNLVSIVAAVLEQVSSESGIDQQPWPKQITHELSASIERLVLYLGEPEPLDQTRLVEEIENLQETIFDEIGIIIPKVNIAKSPVGFQLQINDEKLPIQLFGTPNGYLASELHYRAAQILTLETVKYYLRKLDSDFPALVRVVRYFFSMEKLTQLLRDQLINQTTIKNLPRVLDELLLDEND